MQSRTPEVKPQNCHTGVWFDVLGDRVFHSNDDDDMHMTLQGRP